MTDHSSINLDDVYKSVSSIEMKDLLVELKRMSDELYASKGDNEETRKKLERYVIDICKFLIIQSPEDSRASIIGARTVVLSIQKYLQIRLYHEDYLSRLFNDASYLSKDREEDILSRRLVKY